ncbi:uncharacterized protein C12orf29 homolog isoform X1 [Erpetoichthys calabaricus]|uniref:RNA ligase 1 n=1 Tax=Erpetoichthys calabaricus TaxID=27687 RepID=A0A8C4SFJ4_ERPCA|nr:uncharacterized protein C12orf29 homolog isoform X1 [Erpetoichthys calabaricus]
MRRLGFVQQKIPCAFLTEVKDEPATKRGNQQFRVLANEKLNPKFLELDIKSAIPTEKLDGTCCYVSTYKGKPYLWARLDRKPNKAADRKFKKFLLSKKETTAFVWNLQEDFKSVPESWVAAHGVQIDNGQLQPDDNGHILGWVPVEENNKQYCWHSSVVNYEIGAALILRPCMDDHNVLEIAAVPLTELVGHTLELIGTNVNANPYGLGNKMQPIHLLVPHGVLQIKNTPSFSYHNLVQWFEECEEAKVEGIVWHCSDGSLFKLHRHHLNLQWPLVNTFLSSRPVVITVDLTQFNSEFAPKSLFLLFSKVNKKKFDHLKGIRFSG